MRSIFISTLLLLIVQSIKAQDIPFGTWRTHFSYFSTSQLAKTNDKVFAASRSGLFYYDLTENSTEVLSSLNGLSDAGISLLSFYENKDVLVIGYRNGNLDLIQNNNIINISSIKNTPLSGSKAINAAVFSNDLAYLATDFGIVVVNLIKKEVKDSYLNLGATGQKVAVLSLAIKGDSIYAGTSTGLIANKIAPTVNLADFSTWMRYTPENGLPQNPTSQLLLKDDILFAGIDQFGLYYLSPNGWDSTGFSTTESFEDLAVEENNILIALQTQLIRYNQSSQASEVVSHNLISNPAKIFVDENQHLWIADTKNGLIANFEGEFKSYIPDGPLADVATKLFYADGKVISIFGGNKTIQNGLSGFSVFESGVWKNFSPSSIGNSTLIPNAKSLMDVAYNSFNKSFYFASYGSGLLQWLPTDQTFTLYDANSPQTTLETSISGETLLKSVAVGPEGNVWVINHEASAPLHEYKVKEGTWEAYLRGDSQAQKALQLSIPFTGDKWINLDEINSSPQGILVFNASKQNSSRILTAQTNSGGLESSKVTVIQEDLEGNVWVGTNKGINYFANPFVLSEDNVNAVLPIYDRRALLKDEYITAIAVDGGNRKWIGTPNGLWLFGDFGDTLYYNFTTANSPLPSNNIVSLTVNQQTGEVFISTDQGIVSFRSGASLAGNKHQNIIKVIPNPIYPTYNGKVAITGLVRDAIVKVTDTSGKLIRELRAEGGTAVWDVADYNGRKAAAGIYLIFSSSADGSETFVGKLAVIK